MLRHTIITMFGFINILCAIYVFHCHTLHMLTFMTITMTITEYLTCINTNAELRLVDSCHQINQLIIQNTFALVLVIDWKWRKLFVVIIGSEVIIHLSIIVIVIIFAIAFIFLVRVRVWVWFGSVRLFFECPWIGLPLYFLYLYFILILLFAFVFNW